MTSPDEPHPSSTPAQDLELHGLLALLRSLLSGERGIAAAYLFGSAARGETRARSELDVGLLFREGWDVRDRHLIAADVAGRVVRSRAGLPVDVWDLEDLALVIQGRVMAEGRLLTSNDDVRRVRFEVAVRQRYFDFLPFHRADVREGLRALRRKHSGG